MSGAPKQAVSAAPVSLSAVREQAPKIKSAEMKELLAGPSAVSVVPASCSSAFGVISASTDHTILEAAIEAAGLTSVLDDPALVATVFAPDDEAFTDLLAELELTPEEVSAC